MYAQARLPTFFLDRGYRFLIRLARARFSWTVNSLKVRHALRHSGVRIIIIYLEALGIGPKDRCDTPFELADAVFDTTDLEFLAKSLGRRVALK